MKKIEERVLSASSPAVLTPPIPQWGPSAARGQAPACHHPLDQSTEGKNLRINFRNIVAIVLGAMAILFMTTTALAAEDGKDAKDVKEVVKKLQARYEQTKDLQAEFKQFTKVEGFATPITSSGRMYIKKPGRLRWDYREPNVEEIYVTQNDVMMYVPEHKQVLVGKLTQMAASQAPLQLLQGAARLEEQFAVEATGSEKGEGGLPLLTLLPKHTGDESVRTVVRIVLEVQPKTYFIKRVSIHEISGNVSTFQFTDLKPNAGLKNALFEFKVPAGVEVVKAPALSPP
jgi:outer membrane lipoprotein carrier protein